MPSKSNILTVSDVNRKVKILLEQDLGEVHIEGEISNLKKSVSNHYYFTLKDDKAQLRCAFFKNRFFGQNNIALEEGKHVVASGILSLYEARGDYQLIVNSLSDIGLGKLYQQFEQLKKKLSAEGLFDKARKKTIPFFPKVIGVISSPTGAAIRDILITLQRRYPLATIIVYASEVQGKQAPKQLIKALKKAEDENRADVVIIARGGGSLEDLWAFNDEALARAIAETHLPVISGVGHEMDITICDFVSDERAATPTAAAERATPDCIDLINKLSQYYQRLNTFITNVIHHHQYKLHYLQQKLSVPQRMMFSYWQTVDYLERRLINAILKIKTGKYHIIERLLSHLQNQHPKTVINDTYVKVNQLSTKLNQMMYFSLNCKKQKLSSLIATLQAVSPLATLDRGYAIASKNSQVLFSSKEVTKGDVIDVRLSKGTLTCDVINTGD